MKTYLFAIVLFACPAVFALAPSVLAFCQNDVDLKPNKFVVTYDSSLAKISDVASIMNVVGGAGHTVGVVIDSVGLRYNFAQTSLEKELAKPAQYGRFTLTFSARDPSEEQKNRALGLLEAIASKAGFTVRCQENLAGAF